VLDLEAGEPIVVSLDVTNTGDRPGKEVVQLYIADPKSTVQKPPKELKGFRKVAVDPGQTVTVELSIAARSLQHYDPQLKAWCVEPGAFEILVGTSSADLPLRASFVAAGPNPYAYGSRTTIGTLIEDPRARAVLIEVLPQAVTGPMLGLVAQFVPEMQVGAMFDSWMMRVPGADADQVSALKARLYAALAEIEV
jgi:beta-glucosidase